MKKSDCPEKWACETLPVSHPKTHFIINPKSAGGGTGKKAEELLSAIQAAIGPFTHDFTDAPGAATRLALKALEHNPKVLAVVGGDGTISEVVSGFFAYEAKHKHPSKASIAVINRGTGGDFCRTLGAPSDLHLALEQITKGRELEVDVGRISYTDKNQQKSERYFINVAGCGMAGEVVSAINKTRKRFGGFSYFLTSSQVLWRYRNKRIRLTLDDAKPREYKVVTVAVCNGQFFGGGMQIAPSAQLGDGCFEVVRIGDWNKLQSLWYSKNLYNGSIHTVSKVEVTKARKVLIEPVEKGDRILLDCDGEDVGYAPVLIELLPRAIRFRV